MVTGVFLEEVVPWCKKNGVKLLIMDNDSKFHTKKLVTELQKKGIQVYPGSGKKPWVNCFISMVFELIEDRAENGYPPRSHDCMPDETEFANAQEDAQLDLERREENAQITQHEHVEKCFD